ncbi:molybdopterin-dependent oxidoreductase [Halobaculum sp. MBLA0143]|uniref:molybdopterin-dependent oxidoreductase n=1 Tax=Halobaculum sp. MBLA0143 TaxID=3079933 RepID=UPI003525AE7D
MPFRQSIPFTRTDIALASSAGVAGLLASYAVAGVTPSFVAAPVSAFAAKTLPGAFITFAILVLGDLGQKLNLLTAIVAATVGLAGLAAVGLVVARRVETPGVELLAAPAAAAVALLATGAPTSSLATGAGVAVVLGGGLAADRFDGGAPAVSGDRRRVLGGLPGLVAVGAAAAALRSRAGGERSEPATPDALGGGEEDTTATATHTPTPTPRPEAPGTATASTEAAAGGSGGDGGAGGDADATRTPVATATPTPAPQSEIDRLLAEADRKSLGVDGIQPLVSKKHYEVDINAVNPDVAAGDWSLSLTGRVDEELTLSYDELTSMPADNRFVTLRCVGEARNGRKMDTALWTGVPIDPLLERASPDGACDCVMLRATDGFFEELGIEELRGGLLAFGMNGEVLPRRHGYPVRLLVPGHWGEVNVKWIDEIQFLESSKPGYWEKRNWQGTGEVNTVAKLKTVNRGDGRIEVAGHAYAGVRGVSGVEVSTDGGETWTAARVSDPLPGDDVWRQWVYEYDAPGEEHEVVVRAIESDGTTQSEERTGPFPSGASGWVSRTISP